MREERANNNLWFKSPPFLAFTKDPLFLSISQNIYFIFLVPRIKYKRFIDSTLSIIYLYALIVLARRQPLESIKDTISYLNY